MGRSIGSRVRSRLIRMDLSRSERGGPAARLDREHRLRAIIDVARKESPFYRELYLGTARRMPLEQLPVVTKPELMDRFDEWASRRPGEGGSNRRAVAAIAKLDDHHTIYAGWKFGQQGNPPAGAPEVRSFSVHSPVGQLVRELNAFQPSVVKRSQR